MDETPREVEVVKTAGGVNADSILAALRGNGIPARAHQEALGAVLGLTVDGLGEVSILVPEEFATQARDLLAAGEQGSLQLEDTDATTEPETGER